MRTMLLGLAAGIAAVASAPAAAGPGHQNGVRVFAGSSGFNSGLNIPFTERRSGDRRRGSADVGVWINGGEWAHYNNRAFAPDGYNDWWHDQPNHSQPSWVRNNQDCQRQWFAGDTLRC